MSWSALNQRTSLGYLSSCIRVTACGVPLMTSVSTPGCTCSTSLALQVDSLYGDQKAAHLSSWTCRSSGVTCPCRPAVNESGPDRYPAGRTRGVEKGETESWLTHKIHVKALLVLTTPPGPFYLGPSKERDFLPLPPTHPTARAPAIVSAFHAD